MLKLVADFREIALADAGLLELDWGRVDLVEAASEAAGTVAERARALGKTVDVDADDTAPIAADPARVQSAVARLVRQALQQSAPGSAIELRVETAAIVIAYEAGAPPAADALGVAFATAIARAHGGSLAVAWDEPSVEIRIAFAAEARSCRSSSPPSPRPLARSP